MPNNNPNQIGKDRVMDRPTIRFSHPYFKLNYMTGDNNDVTPVTGATLVNVSKVSLADLPQKFLDYDTSYPNGNYPLKGGEYLLLLFVSTDYRNDEFLFTTIRSYSTPKEVYYRGLIGQYMRVELTQKETNK